MGVNTKEVTEPVEGEKTECVSPDTMVRVVKAAHAGGRRRTSPAAIGEGVETGELGR